MSGQSIDKKKEYEEQDENRLTEEIRQREQSGDSSDSSVDDALLETQATQATPEDSPLTDYSAMSLSDNENVRAAVKRRK